MLDFKVKTNVLWIVLEKIYQAGTLYGITLATAHQVNAKDFGGYMYLLSVVVVINTFVLFVDDRRVKQTYFSSDKCNRTIQHAGLVRVCLAVISVIIGIILTKMTDMSVQNTLLTYLILLFNSIIVALQYKHIMILECQLLSRVASICGVLGLTVGTLIQVMGVLQGEIFLLAIGLFCGNSVKYVCLAIYHHRKSTWADPKISLNTTWASSLIRSSAPLALAAAAHFLYMKTDQIMIRHMVGEAGVGAYALSTQFMMLSLIFLVPTQSSIFPRLAELVKQQLFFAKYLEATRKLTFACLCFILFIWGTSSTFIANVYGPEYQQALDTLPYHLLTAVFFYNAAFRASYLVLIDKVVFIAVIQTLAALFNVSLNFLLIPSMGLEGAAIASLITVIFSLFASNFLYSPTKKIGIIQLWSFFPSKTRVDN